MTLQEIFDRTAAHLLTQRAAAERRHAPGAPAYRGHGGLKCAAGIWIADEHYSEAMEGMNVLEPQVDAALRLSGFPTDNEQAKRLLFALQNVHDDNDPAFWASGLRWLARNLGLDPRVVDTHAPPV